MATNKSSVKELVNKGLAHHKENNIGLARKAYEKALKQSSDNVDALHLLALLEAEQNSEKAIKLVRRAIKISPKHGELYNTLGHVYLLRGDFNHAIENFTTAIEVSPHLPHPYFNQALTYENLFQYQKAVELYKHVLNLVPDHLNALNNQGLLFCRMGDYNLSKNNFLKILELQPDYYKAYNNLGNIYFEKNDFTSASQAYSVALKIQPNFMQAKINLAHVYRAQKDFPKAINLYKSVLDYTDSKINKWLIDRVYIGLALCYVHLCDWQKLNEIYQDIKDKIEESCQRHDDFIIEPLEVAALKFDSDIYKKSCKKYQKKFAVKVINKQYFKNSKPRIGYLSADFRFHPVGLFMSHLLPYHSNNYEIYCYSLQNSDDRIQKIINDNSNFIKCDEMTDQQVINQIAADNIDILIDLSGYTRGARVGILLGKAAKIQMSWLGYASSLWLDEVDYYIATRLQIPQQSATRFKEIIAYLPDALFAFDPSSVDFILPESLPTKYEYNLPEDKFIFCNFNQSYRICESAFTAWMKILNNVPNSVLWMETSGNSEFENNILNHARQTGIDESRVIFKPHKMLNSDWHIGLADLYLDTFFESGGTTTAFALNIGLPVISKISDNPESRIAATLLESAGVPELITTSIDSYIQLATSLAKDKQSLAKQKSKILNNKSTAKLFRPQSMMQDLEALFRDIL